MPEVQTETQAKELRFKMFFHWGGVFIALLGLVIGLATGDWTAGLLLVVAGVISFLFAKRRTRKAGQ